MTSEEGDNGPPPVDFEKLQGTTVLDAGREQIDELELAAGRYALVCFLTNRAGGPPHARAGDGERADGRVGAPGDWPRDRGLSADVVRGTAASGTDPCGLRQTASLESPA